MTNQTYYGFISANNGEQSAWFHTKGAAERFNVACGKILGDVETCDNPNIDDVMDTQGAPWVRDAENLQADLQKEAV